jgi:predicted nucleic acid-binding protein
VATAADRTVKQTRVSKRFLLAALSELIKKLLQTWFVTFADLPSCWWAAHAFGTGVTWTNKRFERISGLQISRNDA